MIELIDEIGRAHIKALRNVEWQEAHPQHAPRCLVLFDAKVPQQEWSTEARMHASWVPEKGGTFKFVRTDVFDALVSLGLVESRGSSAHRTRHRSTQTEIVSYSSFQALRITARGREFLSRKVMVGAMGLFPAKANKWLAFAWGIGGPAAGIAAWLSD